tara:strand:- start:677 stop:1096 length:420 start_codon:yes stop_codon:yes gene_type:complete
MFKRGQIETLGLVVIIILIVFLGLIFLKYSGSGDTSSEDKFLAIKANNFLSAIKQLTIGNNNFEYFVSDCCVGNSYACETVNDAVMSSMNYLEEGADFKLTCFSGVEHQFVVGNCEFGVSSEIFVLSSGDKISLKICRN